MLGPPRERIFARVVTVSVEGLVPPDHRYRHLDRSLDVSFAMNLVHDCYSHIGFLYPAYSEMDEARGGTAPARALVRGHSGMCRP